MGIVTKKSRRRGDNATGGGDDNISVASSTNLEERQRYHDKMLEKKKSKEKKKEIKKNRAALGKQNKKGIAKLIPNWVPGISDVVEEKHIQAARRKSVQNWTLQQEQFELEELEKLSSRCGSSHGRVQGTGGLGLFLAQQEEAGNFQISSSNQSHHHFRVDSNNDISTSIGAVTTTTVGTSAPSSPAPQRTTSSNKVLHKSNSSSSLAAASATNSAVSGRSSGSAMLHDALVRSPSKVTKKAITAARGRSKSFDLGKSISGTSERSLNGNCNGGEKDEPSNSGSSSSGSKGLLLKEFKKEGMELKSINAILQGDNEQLISDTQELKGDNDYLASELETLKKEHKSLKQKYDCVIANECELRDKACLHESRQLLQQFLDTFILCDNSPSNQESLDILRIQVQHFLSKTEPQT